MRVRVDQEQLDRWAAFADKVRATSVEARAAIAQGDTEGACEALTDLHVAAMDAVEQLYAAGALLPATVPMD